MRTFYLFKIKEDVINIYEKKEKELYKTIENLYKLKKENFYYGTSLYIQLCRLFNINIIETYFKRSPKYKKNKNKYLFLGEESFLIEINPSTIVIKTSVNNPSVLKLIHYYDNRIFVCDFENKDYFWLSDVYHKVYNL